MENELIDILNRLGFLPEKRGYHYIHKAIMILIENPSRFHQPITKIYDEIAEEYPVTTKGVESEIRRTIKRFWHCGSPTLANEIFQHSIPYHRDCPSNSEFIMTIADYILVKNDIIF